MKKILLSSVFILISLALLAQTFSILNPSKVDASNGNFSVSGEINTTIEAHMYVVNNTASAADFKVKKVETDIIAGTINTFCFNGQCLPPTVFETSSFMTLQSGDTTLSTDFYADYSPYFHTGASVITYIIVNANDVNDSVSVEVSFNATSTGVNETDYSNVDFSNPYPNPANGFVKFNYNIPYQFSNAALTIRNLIGSTVKEIEISDSQGKLNIIIDDLKEGIYFYSLIVDNNVILTRKFIKN
ncbi:MAG: T9SS type A sorting domain-containing protein [Bacteroidales bacterium]|nr:T9SS type A sorting domain-containing protein [Bacteroidales bacterium]